METMKLLVKNTALIVISFLLFSPSCALGKENFQNYDFSSIDRHALSIKRSQERELKKLTTFLIRPAKNDAEKARAIFRWITDNIRYDTKSYFKGDTGVYKSADLLKLKTSVCEGYSNMFLDMATLAGLKAVKISGFSKGYGFKDGGVVTAPNHAWNGVMINGNWYLIDATWGSGYINDNKKFVKRFEDFFFLTAPSKLIYTHFPVEKKWQLLKKTINEQTFARTVNLAPEFFKTGLTLKSHRENSFTADKPLTMEFNSTEEVSLMLNVFKGGKAIDKSLIFQRKTKDGYGFDIKFPKKGDYKIVLYATKDKFKPNSPNSPNRTISLTESARYNVTVKKGAVSKSPFPSQTGLTAFEGTIIKPIYGVIKKGEPQEFKLRLPWAVEVRANIADLKDNTYHIKETIPFKKEADGTFSLVLTPHTNSVFINGTDRKGTTRALLSYKVK